MEGDWVTVGVLVKRVTQKQSASGKNFCVWHISDLQLGSENHVVALFLFGESYKEHWKIQVHFLYIDLNFKSWNNENINDHDGLYLSDDFIF